MRIDSHTPPKKAQVSNQPTNLLMSEEETDAPETYSFQAEINQLLSLIINTFYTNKDVFLRELISNASDALNKARFNRSRADASEEAGADAASEETAPNAEHEYCVRIVGDETANTLTVFDSGVGMTKQELIDNLGTVAQSGTKSFMQKIIDGGGGGGGGGGEGTNAAGSNVDSMIGQFGVGFYSAYLIADRVSVTTKSAGSGGGGTWHTWDSTANGTFTIRTAEAPPSCGVGVAHGTSIVLHLKPTALDYLKGDRITGLIQTYSQFIQYPIYLQVTRSREVEDEDAADKEDKAEKEGEDKDEVTVEDVTEAEKDKGGGDATDDGKKKLRVETYLEWERQNEQKPIWVRAADEVTDEDHCSFYKSITKDWDGPLCWRHIAAEGALDFKGVIYVPKRAPFDLYDSTKKHSIKLYVKRVFVMDETDELVPEWLKFLRGLVDSEDLPLNISRELLQKNQVVKLIQKNLVKKCIEMFTEMADERPEDYATFYNNYSKCIKLGVTDESKHKDKLLKLLRYTTSVSLHSDDEKLTVDGKKDAQMVSLEKYVGRMKKGQKGVYFITGETDRIIDESPFIEKLKNAGIEVLYMSDPMDEYVMQGLKEYDGHKFISCTRGGEDMNIDEDPDESDAEAAKAAKAAEEARLKPLCERIRTVLGNQVDSVLVGSRLVESPCCLVASQYGWTANMERIMRAQALRDNSRSEFMSARKIMEINPMHRIIEDLVARLERIKGETAGEEEGQAKREEKVEKAEKAEKGAEEEDDGDGDGDGEKLIDDVIHLMYESSLIDSGFTLDTPKRFVSRINNMICLGLSLDDEPLACPVDDPSARVERVEDPAEISRIVEAQGAVDADLLGLGGSAPQ